MGMSNLIDSFLKELNEASEHESCNEICEGLIDGFKKSNDLSDEEFDIFIKDPMKYTIISEK